MTVREAFERSVNLVFVRLIRDIERYYVARILNDSRGDLLTAANPVRRQYLTRFADQEGRVFLSRFYRKYVVRAPNDALETLVRNIYPSPVRVAVVYRSVRPDGSLEQFTDFLRRHVRPPLSQERAVAALYEKYALGKFSLADRGYLARVHPLELWLVCYLQQHPKATFSEVVNASADERQQAYVWLFRTRHRRAQDRRIRVLVEEDAFKEITLAWR